MIEKLIVENFAVHKKLELEFHPEVNVIFGANDSGKSTIVRIIDYLINNNCPMGVDYLSDYLEGSGTLKIAGTFDGNLIERIRETKTTKTGKKLLSDSYLINNIYKIIPSDSKEFERVTNLAKFSDLTIQYQSDPPFLLLDKAGEISRYLNKTIDLEEIDYVASNIEKSKRENSKLLKETEKKLVKINNELLEFKELDRLENIYIRVSDLNEKISNNKFKITIIEHILNEIDNLNILLQNQKSFIKLENKIKNLDQLNDKIQNNYNKIEILEVFKYKISFYNADQMTLKTLIDKEKIIKSLLNSCKKLEENNKLLEKIVYLIKYNSQLKTKIKNNNLLIEKESIIKQLLALCTFLEALEKNKKEIISKQKEIILKQKEINVLQEFILDQEKEFKEMIGEECPIYKGTRCPLILERG